MLGEKTQRALTYEKRDDERIDREFGIPDEDADKREAEHSDEDEAVPPRRDLENRGN